MWDDLDRGVAREGEWQRAGCTGEAVHAEEVAGLSYAADAPWSTGSPYDELIEAMFTLDEKILASADWLAVLKD